MHTERFTGRAELYDSYRPAYPDSMYDYIYANILKTGAVIADIGSGTGILSEGFLKRGNTVYAVEPNEDMRSAGEKRLKSYPVFVSVAGTADNTTLKDNSVDMVSVAQAFHWFDPLLFSAECRRILRAGGSVAIIYNRRAQNSPFVQELAAISDRLEPAPAKNQDFEGFFQGRLTFKTFDNTTSLDLSEFIGNMLSSSRAPLKGGAGYEPYLRDLETLFGRFESNGRIVMPYLTDIYHGQLKDI